MDETAIVRELAGANNRLRQSEEQVARLEEHLRASAHEVIRNGETGLFSTAYFHARLQDEIGRAERYRHFLTLVLIHLELSDPTSTGRLSGELALIGGRMKRGLIRGSDLLALYRHSQLVILLPETDERGARTLIKRLGCIMPENGRRVTYSTLNYPHDASNIELLLNRLQDHSENLLNCANSIHLRAG